MSDSLKTIKLKCEACGGELEIKAEKSIAVCPFCGSTSLIIEDKDITIEKIRNDTVKDTNSVRREELKLQKEELKLRKETLKYPRSIDEREENRVWSNSTKEICLCAYGLGIFRCRIFGDAFYTIKFID